jgi:protein TonB
VDQQQEKKSGGKKILLMVTVVLLVFGLIGWGLKSLLSGKSGAKPKPPKISLMAPPPPPPPPPPKFEKKPPEPPKDQKEIKIDQPLAKQEQAPADPQLKMEGAAGDGPSMFAKGAVTSEDLSKLGNGTGKAGMFNPYSNYANLLKGELQRYLSKNNLLRKRQYRTEVQIWVNPDGSVKRAELLGGTGEDETDEELRKTLSSLPQFTDLPPPNMPQPIRLRLLSSGR